MPPPVICYKLRFSSEMHLLKDSYIPKVLKAYHRGGIGHHTVLRRVGFLMTYIN
jgi:hypothetical protein